VTAISDRTSERTTGARQGVDEGMKWGSALGSENSRSAKLCVIIVRCAAERVSDATPLNARFLRIVRVSRHVSHDDALSI